MQHLSDFTHESIRGSPEIKADTLTTTPRTSLLFKWNDLLPILRHMDEETEEIDNELNRADVFEIEVPVIGSEYGRTVQVIADRYDNKHEDYKADDSSESFAYFKTLSTTSRDLPASSSYATDTVTLSNDFQTTSNTETTVANVEKTTAAIDNTEKISNNQAVDQSSDRHFAESKNVEQWQAIEELTTTQSNTVSDRDKVHFHYFSKDPMSVKIIVNNPEARQMCINNQLCQQVTFKNNDKSIDPAVYYSDYSDEELMYRIESDHYHSNQLKSRNARRAAEDTITPAPRFTPIIPGFMSNILKKPPLIERLEQETSLERSERINNDLERFAKFVSVLAKVDSFFSNRARTAISRLAKAYGDYDDSYVSSPQRRQKNIRPLDDVPFT